MSKERIERLEAENALLKANNLERERSTSLQEELNARLSATGVALKALDVAGLVVGDVAQRFALLNEQLLKSTAGAKDLQLNKDQLKKSLFELSEESKNYGISIKQNYEFAGDLTKQNVKLLDVYKKSTPRLTDFVGRLKAFSVETKTSYEMIGTLTSNLDMNAAQLDTTRRSLVGFARQTGQSVQEVVESYTKNIKSFMDFLDPKQMNRAYMQFQVMARRMGMEANQLYGIATKFDTIEQSQQIGARMNQIFSTLGIEFNALALQEMEPKQRVEYLSKKTREALTRARGMGGMEGRLITRALQEAGGFADPAQLRAFAAEGGGRRATTPFERGGERLTEVDRREEALLARRENFLSVQRANAAIMTEAATRQTKSFKDFDKLINRFPRLILDADRRFDKLKQEGANLAAKAADKKMQEAIAQAVRALELEAPLPPAIQKIMNDLNIKVGTLGDAVDALALSLSKDKFTQDDRKKIIDAVAAMPAAVVGAIKAIK